MPTRRAPSTGGTGARTRRRIVDAARRSFAEKGYAATSVSTDVLKPSGISVGSFYHQFADKAELFAAVVEDSAAAAQRSVAEAHHLAGDRDLLAVATQVWDRIFALADAHEDLFRIVTRERITNDPAVAEAVGLVRSSWVGSLADVYRSYPDAPADFPADAAAEMVAALGTGILEAYLDLPPSDRSERRGHLVADLACFTVGGVDALARRSAGPA